MARNGAAITTVPSVLTIPFTVYVRARLSAEIDSDVEPVTVTMVLSRKSGPWHMDSVDLDQLHLMLPRIGRKGNQSHATMEPVIRKAATILRERGIDPVSVKRWNLNFPQFLVQRVIYD